MNRTVTHAERASNVLTTSRLACIAGQPTVNVTRGCIHRCAYCYARGYRAYPGDGRVVVYTNTAEKIRSELDRRRRRPDCVYFSPSCDAFQAIPEVLDQTYACMATLLRRGIAVSFLTKGAIPRRFLDLFERHAQRVHGQIDLTTLEDAVQSVLEPYAAAPARRLLDLRRLVSAGVRAEARIDPLIPGLTDRPRMLRRLLAALATMGVTSVAVNYLVLRPAIREHIGRDLCGFTDTRALFRLYRRGVDLPLKGHGALVRALPADYRRRAYGFIRRTGEAFGIEARVCGCKNADVADERCNINGPALALAAEPTLFAMA